MTTSVQPLSVGWPGRPGGPAGPEAMKILQNDFKIKDSGPRTFIFEKSAKNYVRGFNESF